MRNGTLTLRRISLREVTTEKVQRWWCENCRTSFTFRKHKKRQHFADIFIKEAVKDFIQGRSSYAVIKERKDVSVGTLSTWVHQFGSACLSPVEISGALRLRTFNRWSGILLLDGKYLNKRLVLLLAIDSATLDIVAHLVCEGETIENYTILVDMVEACGYVIAAIVSDGEGSIIALTQPSKPLFERKGTRTYPRPGIAPAKQKTPRLLGIPHQWCVIHAQRDIERDLRKLPDQQRQSLAVIIHNILFADTLPQAQKWKEKLVQETWQQTGLKGTIQLFILSHWNMLTIHHTVRINGRKIPRDSNTIENVISYVTTRLKTIRRIRTKKSAEAICNLIVVNFRCKPLASAKNKLKRGKSPLELATRKKQRFDWLEFIKKSTP